jgi:hypothetical protein
MQRLRTHTQLTAFSSQSGTPLNIGAKIDANKASSFHSTSNPSQDRQNCLGFTLTLFWKS